MARKSVVGIAVFSMLNFFSVCAMTPPFHVQMVVVLPTPINELKMLHDVFMQAAPESLEKHITMVALESVIYCLEYPQPESRLLVDAELHVVDKGFEVQCCPNFPKEIASDIMKLLREVVEVKYPCVVHASVACQTDEPGGVSKDSQTDVSLTRDPAITPPQRVLPVQAVSPLDIVIPCYDGLLVDCEHLSPDNLDGCSGQTSHRVNLSEPITSPFFESFFPHLGGSDKSSHQ